jgi:hypothetical protein
VKRLALLSLLLLLLAGCGSVIESFPQRKCLYYGDRRFSEGSVVAKRGDGARLFQFKDSTEGDRGYRWVTDDDVVKIRPCPSGSGDQRFGAESNTPPETIPNP